MAAKKTTVSREESDVACSMVSDIQAAAIERNSHAKPKADKMLAERVKLLYCNLPASIAISALLALILVSVQAEVVGSDRLIGWTGVIATIFAGRAILFVAWKRYARATDRSDALSWLYRFRIGVFAAGLVWGVGGVLFVLSGDPEHKTYTLLALAGLSAGAATTLATDRLSVVSFLLLTMVPQSIFLVIEGSSVSLGISAMVALFLLFLMASARQLSLQLEENFYLRVMATENESRLRQMLESSPIATSITDAASNQVAFANSGYIALIESTSAKIMGIDPTVYYADPEIYAEVREQVLKGGNVTDRTIELRSPGNFEWSKWVLASYFRIEYQNQTAILGWFYDITDRKIKEDHVEHMAYHDPLTGLPNRSLFLDRLNQSLASAEREQGSLALMFLDLDKFKPVNDLYGHHVGDLLLKAVAERVSDCLRKSDSVARIGGDEFVVLLPSVNTEESALEVAEKIRYALNLPFEIGGLTIDISSSSGLAIYPDHAEDAQLLIERADTAMYYAKADGKNCVRVYRPQMLEQAKTPF